MVIQRPIVTHRDPTRADPSSHARGRERSIARKNLARPMRARDDADADADAMGRCDGTARRGDETRATRASVVACERDAT